MATLHVTLEVPEAELMKYLKQYGFTRVKCIATIPAPPTTTPTSTPTLNARETTSLIMPDNLIETKAPHTRIGGKPKRSGAMEKCYRALMLHLDDNIGAEIVLKHWCAQKGFSRGAATNVITQKILTDYPNVRFYRTDRIHYNPKVVKLFARTDKWNNEIKTLHILRKANP